MDKKFLSCLSYTLHLTVSFFLLGFTEAAWLPQKFLSPASIVSLKGASTDYSSVSTSFTLDEKMEEQDAFCPQQQAEVYGVTPPTAVIGGQSDLIRKFPAAILVICRLQLGFWQSADDLTYFLPVSFSMAPGLPVLFRTLRL